MSGVVSYELFVSRFGSSGTGITSEGGLYETLINNTGTSVKGTIVVASASVDNAVDIAPANSEMALGVIYENGIANGASVKVVAYGKAQVLLKNSLASTRGYWCGASDTSGRMYQTATPSTAEHYRQIGHSLQTVSSGTDVLALIQLNLV